MVMRKLVHHICVTCCLIIITGASFSQSTQTIFYTTKDGLPRVYDADLKAPTYLFVRGDERNPDKSKALEPGIPEALGGRLTVQPVALPAAAVTPDRREFVQRDLINGSNAALLAAFRAQAAKPSPLADAEVVLAQAKHKALLAILEVEATSAKAAAELTVQAQREVAVAEARKNLLASEEKKRSEVQKALDTAEAALKQPLNTNNGHKRCVGRALYLLN